MLNFPSVKFLLHLFSPSLSLSPILHTFLSVCWFLWAVLRQAVDGRSLCPEFFSVKVKKLTLMWNCASLSSPGSTSWGAQKGPVQVPGLVLWSVVPFATSFRGEGSTGVWTQGFTLTKQKFYHLSHTSSPFYSGYFGDGGRRSLTNYLPRLASNRYPLDLAYE
jgi:hypothetical protein